VCILVAAQFTNSAVSATTWYYTSQCVSDFVPEDADLVLVEFSVNDWETVDPATFTWMDNSLRQALPLRTSEQFLASMPYVQLSHGAC
jgi:hypothetical protein